MCSKGNIFDPPPTAPGRTVSPAQLLWLTGFLCGWSVGLEFPAGQLAESNYYREKFQTFSEDFSVRNVLMHAAHLRFHDDALYKSTFLLTLPGQSGRAGVKTVRQISLW